MRFVDSKKHNDDNFACSQRNKEKWKINSKHKIHTSKIRDEKNVFMYLYM